ncbi:hypothetical protein GCM10022253_28170 [Sphingomonas endophytica]
MLRDTFAAGGELAQAAVSAQTSERLNPTVGHQFLAAIGAANLAIGEALARTAQGHRQLEVLSRRLGLDPTAYGDGLKPPSATMQSDEEALGG